MSKTGEEQQQQQQQLLLLQEELESGRRQLEECVEANPQDPSLRFHLAVFLWEKCKLKEKAAEHFVLTVKLNPQNADAFQYLGHYYSSLSGSQNQRDIGRAIKCYQRAVSINPDDSQSGEALRDLLDQSGKETLILAVCNQASQSSPRAFWAFATLGYLHLHHNRCSQAVHTLQHAIRGFPTSPDLWEALGLSYQKLGMFTAAIKSYGRSIELDNTRVFPLIQSGNIFYMLGNFRKGVEQFRQALDISPQDVSANYGLASGLLGWSKECMSMGAFKWGSSLLEDAGKVANKITQLAGNFSCIWKLHADIQFTYAKCFPWMEEDWSIQFDVKSFHASIHSWKQTCHLAALSARMSYQRALHFTPWQANLYVDIGITSDFISSMNKNYGQEKSPWQLSEKMALGALLLEGDNYEFWVALGCLSGYNALRQHALIRGLQLDVSLAIAWAYLGKLYRDEGEKHLARQAFDCARSIDPSLALPWAGMSADAQFRDLTPEEAFESCSRAVQILPLAEFQIGLAKLALLSGNTSSSQVFGAIQQAVQHAPHYPESHNLHGLVCEARSEYQAAVSSYRLARCAINISSENASKSHFRNIAINLARSLSRAGHAAGAVQECEGLRKEGLLDVEGMQIYALSLWQLGKNDLALPVVRNLAASVSMMERTTAIASVRFICRLLYYISGLDSAITSILKIPKELLQSTKVYFLASAIHALDLSNRIESALSSSHYSLSSHDEIIGWHYLIALAKLVKQGSEYCLGFQNGISHLKKALHMHPNSNLLRNLLGHVLLSCEEWKEAHAATRCCITEAPYQTSKEGLKSGCEILGAGAVACYAVGNKDPKFSFPTCGYQCLYGPGAVQELQKYMRQKPWNHNARYLLILNLLQKAREERFSWKLCVMLERLMSVALSNQLYSRESMSCQYQKFQLLLCASEICLQSGNQVDCVKQAKIASSLLLHRFCFLDYFSAEESLAEAGSLTSSESCISLCHGVTCMELARQFCCVDYLSLAIRSLTNAHSNSVVRLPVVSLLLAQAEGSLGSKQKWEKNLRFEWYSWPPEMRPAELFFQMHLLASQSEAGFESPSREEFCQSPLKWVIRAIHTNPSCLRYWNVLQKLIE